MPIWVMEKQDPSQAVHPLVEDEEESETDIDNLESVAGRLLDISEGGAALRVDAATRSVYLSTRAVASSSHAAMKATPPRGVMAPSQRVPVRLKR